MPTFQDRVRELAKSLGGPEKLADASGLSRRTIGAYLAGETEPKRPDLVKLARSGGVSVGWLANEEGPANVINAQHTAQPRQGYVYLPLYDVSASAGGGSLTESENVVDVLAFKEDWIRRELRARPADLNLIYVEGDSMEPDLRAGDIVLLDHTDTMARREGVYVIRMDGALLVKQLQRLPGGIVKVISRNSLYEPFTVPLTTLEAPNGFAVIGRVVWACRRF